MNPANVRRLNDLRSAEREASDELENLLSHRAGLLREIGPNERSCEYGPMYRADIRVRLAAVRALRVVIKSAEREAARDKAIIELNRLALTKPRLPVPQDLLDAAFMPRIVIV